MESQIFELQYALDTFYFLICGALVMWMAAGFTMLEAGLVRSKNTVEILTKNVALFATASIMYMVCGYAIMYGGDLFLSGIAGGDTLVEAAGCECGEAAIAGHFGLIELSAHFPAGQAGKIDGLDSLLLRNLRISITFHTL